MISWLGAPDSVSSMSDDELRQAHVSLQGNVRLLRRVVPLVCLALIAGFSYQIYNTGRSIKPDAVVAALDKQSIKVLPKIQKSAGQVGERVAPIVSKAFAKHLNKAMAGLGGRLDIQMKKLGESLPATMEGELKRRLEEANTKQLKILTTAFPELAKDPAKVERLMANFQGGFSKWAQKTLAGTFAGHLKELDNIKSTLNGFVAKQKAKDEATKASDAKDGKLKAHDKITPEQLLGMWIEIMDESLKGGGESDLLTAPTKDLKAAKKGKKRSSKAKK
ncbi:MAG TPA: hypothetical protein DCQ06_02525 [Myxococcales bacterium]|nr:hypothetical protein [Myxococcales bacterium]